MELRAVGNAQLADVRPCGYSETLLDYGTGKAMLNCTTNQYQNPNWTLGEIWSDTTTKCTAELQIQAMAVKID